MEIVRPLIFATVLSANLASCGPHEEIPEPDVCEEPGIEGVSGIEFLTASGQGPLAERETMKLYYGPQGGVMLAMRFGLQGDAVPACANFDFVMELCFDSQCSASEVAPNYPLRLPLLSYEAAVGRATKEHLMELPLGAGSGSLVRISAAIGTTQNSILLWAEKETPFADADADAG